MESQKEITYLTNTVLPAKLAYFCLKHSIHFINVGSGCIYYGESPNKINGVDIGWKEDDFANPISYYSKSKYSCDLMLSSINVTTLRIRMPISEIASSRNLIDKISKYDKIIDIQNSVTFLKDFKRCVNFMIKEKLPGIFHVTNPGTLSALDILNEYKKYKHLDFSVISEAELDNLTIAKRSNCIINTEKLNKAGFFLTPVEEALKETMATYIK